jgi:hypothetical protein
MSMLKVHALALETGTGAYHEFLLAYQTFRPIVYAFVEGKEDPSYYRGFIENALPDGWTARLIRGGNRNAVLDILNFMPWERFQRRRICFFIDRDLSEYLDELQQSAENLYITDNYSIENDVVNSYVFTRVMEEIFGISDVAENERECICQLFEGNLRSFCQAMAPVMAQVLIWRRKGVRAPLDNIKPQGLFSFNSGKLETVPKYSSPFARVGYAATCVGFPRSDEALLRAVENEFRDRGGLTRFIRGKYLIWLFVGSAVAVHAAIASYCTRYAKPPRVRTTLGAANAITILGPRAKVPNTLKKFIEINYLAYIRDLVAA